MRNVFAVLLFPVGIVKNNISLHSLKPVKFVDNVYLLIQQPKFRFCSLARDLVNFLAQRIARGEINAISVSFYHGSLPQ